MSNELGVMRRRSFLKYGVALPCLLIAPPGKAKRRAGRLRIETLHVEWQSRPVCMDNARPRFHWSLGSPDSEARNLLQAAFQLVIAAAANPQVNVLDSGVVQSSRAQYRLPDDPHFESQTAYVARLVVFDPDGIPSSAVATTFITGLMSSEHRKAQWIAAEAHQPERREGIEGHWQWIDKGNPLPIFQQSFEVRGRPRSAHLLMVGLGQYQLFLNGKQISPDGVNGSWTNYDRHVVYDGYDVTEWIGLGSHVLRIELGNGFFNVEAVRGRYSKFDGRYGQPMAWLQLRLEYPDGTESFVVTDDHWQVCRGGTLYSSIYGGEDYDARIEPSIERDGLWRPAVIVSGPTGALVASTFAPMTLRRRLSPVAIHANAPGGPVYDFGVNHSGRPRLRISRAVEGTEVKLVPAELLAPDGSPDQASMSGGGKPGLRGIEFNYVCAGGDEEWSPRFTYTGYRYLQIRGIALGQVVVESEFLSDDLPEGGTFDTSDGKLASVHQLIRQALISNAASVLTDCPHREKLGWLEQIYLNATTTMNNLDCVRLYEKMCRDIRDAQERSGRVPAIAPEFVKFLDQAGRSTRFRDSPEWGAAVTLATWYAFQHYGDIGILEQNYNAIAARLAYLETCIQPDGLLDFGLGDWYDLGPKPPGYAQLTSLQMTGTATFYAELQVMAQMTQKLNLPQVDHYARRGSALKATLQQRLLHPDTSTFDTGSQTAQAMGLVLGLFPDEHRKKALEGLVADIRARGNHVTAGDIGFHYVVRALSDGGRSDVLYDLLTQTTKPAYLQQIANGATSLTEAWDGGREASQNHFMLGHAEIWLFQGLGGLQIDHGRTDGTVISLAPQIVPQVANTVVTANTMMGRVRCETAHKAGFGQVHIVVPVGQRAEIRLPFLASSPIREGGRSLAAIPGAQMRKSPSGQSIIEVGSGSYSFSGRVACTNA